MFQTPKSKSSSPSKREGNSYAYVTPENSMSQPFNAPPKRKTRKAKNSIRINLFGSDI